MNALTVDQLADKLAILQQKGHGLRYVTVNAEYRVLDFDPNDCITDIGIGVVDLPGSPL